MRLVGLPEQHGELSRRDIDRMALDHARMGAFAREAQFLGRTGKEFFHGRRQRIRGAGRNQPASGVGNDGFLRAAMIGGDDRLAHRLRLEHDAINGAVWLDARNASQSVRVFTKWNSSPG